MHPNLWPLFQLLRSLIYLIFEEMRLLQKLTCKTVWGYNSPLPHLLFSPEPVCDEESWCRSVSRRMPCCANIWGLCPASSISCSFPTCHTTQAR